MFCFFFIELFKLFDFFNFSNILELAQREPGKLCIFFKIVWRPPDISIELKIEIFKLCEFLFFNIDFLHILELAQREPGKLFWRPPDCFFELLKLFDFSIFVNILELAQREPGKLFIFFNLNFLEASRFF